MTLFRRQLVPLATAPFLRFKRVSRSSMRKPHFGQIRRRACTVETSGPTLQPVQRPTLPLRIDERWQNPVAKGTAAAKKKIAPRLPGSHYLQHRLSMTQNVLTGHQCPQNVLTQNVLKMSSKDITYVLASHMSYTHAEDTLDHWKRVLLLEPRRPSNCNN